MKIEIEVKNIPNKRYEVTIKIGKETYKRTLRNDYQVGMYIGEIVQSELIERKDKEWNEKE